MQALDSSRSSVLEPQRSKAPTDVDANRKQELGQFLTPATIGSFMTSLFEARQVAIRPLETSNLCTGFLALAGNLLCEVGELVAICPRSFCNGRYLRGFRSKCSKSDKCL